MVLFENELFFFRFSRLFSRNDVLSFVALTYMWGLCAGPIHCIFMPFVLYNRHRRTAWRIKIK